MFYLEFDNGLKVNARDKGWKIIDMHVPDVTSVNDKDSASGVPGSIFYGIEVGDRESTLLSFDAHFNNLKEWPTVKSEMLRIFNSGVAKLYMRWDGGNPSTADRFLKVAKSDVQVSRIGMKARVEVTFETVELPFFESRQLKTNTYSNLADITHTNSGDVELDHRYTNTKYEIVFKGSASFFQITLNGVRWRFTGSISSGDELVIENGTAYFNGKDVLEDTTMNVFILKPGQNTLSILGSMQYQLRIITKEYYY